MDPLFTRMVPLSVAGAIVGTYSHLAIFCVRPVFLLLRFEFLALASPRFSRRSGWFYSGFSLAVVATLALQQQRIVNRFR